MSETKKNRLMGKTNLEKALEAEIPDAILKYLEIEEAIILTPIKYFSTTKAGKQKFAILCSILKTEFGGRYVVGRNMFIVPKKGIIKRFVEKIMESM